MHEFISHCVCVCVLCCHPPGACLPLCVCPSHPSRAVHLYLSQTSIEIDSSDGMISEASTKDPSSSEEEGPSSDDDDGGDDSDWGCGDGQGDRNTEATQEARWRDARMAPMDYVPRLCWVETRWRELCCRCVENKHIVQELEENGKKVLLESFCIRTKRLERWRSRLWNGIKSRVTLLLIESRNIHMREEMLDLTCRVAEARGIVILKLVGPVSWRQNKSQFMLNKCCFRHGSCYVWEVSSKISCNMQLEEVRMRKLFSEP